MKTLYFASDPSEPGPCYLLEMELPMRSQKPRIAFHRTNPDEYVAEVWDDHYSRGVSGIGVGLSGALAALCDHLRRTGRTMKDLVT